MPKILSLAKIPTDYRQRATLSTGVTKKGDIQYIFTAQGSSCSFYLDVWVLIIFSFSNFALTQINNRITTRSIFELNNQILILLYYRLAIITNLSFVRWVVYWVNDGNNCYISHKIKSLTKQGGTLCQKNINR